MRNLCENIFSHRKNRFLYANLNAHDIHTIFINSTGRQNCISDLKHYFSDLREYRERFSFNLKLYSRINSLLKDYDSNLLLSTGGGCFCFDMKIMFIRTKFYASLN